MTYSSRLAICLVCATPWALNACGLALGLDDYTIQDDSVDSSGGKSNSTGDGDGDNLGGETQGSGGEEASSGGAASGGDTATGGREDDGSGGAATGGDSSSGGAPACHDDQASAETDFGCDDEMPFCDNGTCVQCRDEADCSADEIDCTSEECNSGVCERLYDDSACPNFGLDVCIDTQCTATGCEDTDISVTVDLLEGQGDFEDAAPWQVLDDAEITTPINGSAHGGTQVALMTSAGDEFGNVYMNLQVPPTTQSLTVEGFYRAYNMGTDHDNDYFMVGFWDTGAETWFGLVLDTQGSQSAAMVNMWTAFSGTVPYEDLIFVAPDTVEFDLAGFTNAGYNIRHFAADDVRVLARTCGQ